MKHAFPFVLLTCLTCGLPADAAGERVNEEFFREQVYPVFRAVQCDLCHNDNGVASETDLEFPAATATDEQVTAFGLRLMDMVDFDDPDQSWLVLKPTNREEHTGGERILRGSDEEQKLIRWASYLASLDAAQQSDARRRIELAERWSLEPLTVRRLTHSQYNNTVRDLLGDLSQPANRFPKEDFVNGFKNQLEAQGVSPLQAEAYALAAERLANSAFRGGDRLGLIDREAADVAATFVRSFGRKAFRRPLTAVEAIRYQTLFDAESERTNDTLAAARIVIETMLQSPHFLYRIERGSDGPFEEYETAARLSYFLWDTMPDTWLLNAAEAGQLATPEGVEQAARQMLADPRSASALDEFLSQWMRFDQVLGATRDRRKFRNFNTELAAAMVEETRRLFHHLVWQDQNFMEFYTADYTFLNADLADIYGLPTPPDEFGRVNYPADSGRSGVLGHATFLVATSKPSETSPTSRGVFVRSHFLSHEVPPPPPGTDTMLPEVTEDTPMTNRQRLAIHLNSEACSGCHRLVDPIGFGFEQYDAIGRFREKVTIRPPRGRYGGNSRETPKNIELDLDTTAYLQGVEGAEFSTPKELGKILAASEACQRCVVKQLFRYTFGRRESRNDQVVIDRLLDRFRDSGFRFQELIVALVTSELFLEGGSPDYDTPQ